MDYLDDANAADGAASRVSIPGSEPPAADLELDSELNAEQAADEQDIDPFLRELLPEDRNARRRVVTALLRAVLAERKIT